MGKKISVSDAELEILEVLWSAGASLNANEIRTRLGQNKSWERTTVLTLIQRLLKKNVLRQEKREVYYYTPASDARNMSGKRRKISWTNFLRVVPGIWRRRW